VGRPGVPNGVGMTQGERSRYSRRRLQNIKIASAYSAKVPAGLVASQSPKAGSTAGTGATVKIVVSLGPPPGLAAHNLDARATSTCQRRDNPARARMREGPARSGAFSRATRGPVRRADAHHAGRADHLHTLGLDAIEIRFMLSVSELT